MLIVPLPWSRSELEYLMGEADVFDLIMENSAQTHYLVIQEDTITLVGAGTVPGKFAVQLKTRSATMNGDTERPKNCGNIGFLGDYSSVDEFVLKKFPRGGYCVSNMCFSKYSGQKLKPNKNHYSLIEPIVCLMREESAADLQHFFKTLGWGNRKSFTCTGNWNYNMKLYIGEKQAANLEVWFANYCAIALG